MIVDKKSKAEHIARAAVSVFRTRGFHQTRMTDIAEAAGVGKGTLYEYFNDKSQMLTTVLEHYFEDFHSGALAAVMAVEGASNRLRALVAFAVGHAEEWEEYCAVFFDTAGSGALEERGRAWLTTMFDEARTLVSGIVEAGQEEGVFRRDIPAAVLAEMVVALYEGYVLMGVMGVRRGDPDEIRDAMIEVLEKGMKR